MSSCAKSFQRIMLLFFLLFGLAASELQNVALSKPTSQSSFFGGSAYSSSKAVDGDKSSNAVLFHSNKMQDNWWKVHLFNFYEIQSVIIYNRVDCCSERLRGFQVDIFKSGVSVFTFNPDDPNANPGSAITIDVPSGVIGDEVKLSLPGRTDYINIREVEVLGELSDEAVTLQNVALNKPTTQSSTIGDPASSYDSSKAVDGDKSDDATLFHSGKVPNNWWKVHLIDMYDIDKVVIYNRISCCPERLRGYQVDIYHSGVPVFTYTDDDPNSVPDSTTIINIPSGVTGDTVKLSLPGRTDYINIREVEVYGEISDDSSTLSNIALSKLTSQSSMLDPSFESSKAVDGDKSLSAAIFHTKRSKNNWWNVQLMDIYSVKKLAIYNRADCCQNRLSGYQIEIYKSGDQVFTFYDRSPKASQGTIEFIDIPAGVVGDEVRLSIAGKDDYLHAREVEVYGSIPTDTDSGIKYPLFPEFQGTEYAVQHGTQSSGTTITSFDKNDYLTYPMVNFGNSGQTKSIRFTYSKGNAKGQVEVRLGGPSGTLIGTFHPMNTGGWDVYVRANIQIDLVEGLHDLTFVGIGVKGVWNLASFGLSETLVFQIMTDYRVDDTNGRDIQCTYDVVKNAYKEKVFNKYYSDLFSTVEESLFAHLGVETEAAAQDVVDNLCASAQDNVKGIPLNDITYDEGSQFIELYYAGRTQWNEETQTNLFPSDGSTPAQVLKEDAYKVKDYKTISERAMFEMPNLPQFDTAVCTSHAAQCCWPRDRQANDNNGNCATPYDSGCVDKDVADNTDLCYNELDKAPYVSGIEANGFSSYGDEGPIHCHGFAWSRNERETTTRYKANALFFISMYDHMYQRGYVENIPGSPMCGCVEHMPVVTRSDCTQTNVQEYYTFYKNNGTPGFSSVLDGLNLQFQSCQGANNKNNDLSAFVQQLVNDGKLTTTEQKIFKSRVVGKKKCPAATQALLKKFGFESGYNIDESKWTFIVGEGFQGKQPILNDRLFREMFEAQDVPIVRRVCPSCTDTHKDIYYRRLKPIPQGFDLLDTLMNNWFDTDNVLNEDFALYSTHLDAFLDTNRWAFCNYNDPGIGFPRDCGPTAKVDLQWNSYIRHGGRATHHAFLIQTDPDFQSDLQYENVALNKTTWESLALKGHGSSKAVDGDKSENAALFHTNRMLNNWWMVNLQGFYTIGRIVIFNRVDCCSERLRGYQVDILKSGVPVFTYNHENPDSSPGRIVIIDVPPGVIGDEVKLSLPGRSDYMNIREVEVYGEFHSDSTELQNVALNKPTLQSSILGKTGSNYEASKAVDGDKSENAALFHTDRILNNWWMVDLQGFYTIGRIIIFNRVDCCSERLRGYQVDILKSGVPVFTYNHKNPNSSPGTTIIVDVPPGVIGDEVKLSLPGRSDYMNIREVEVYGEFHSDSTELQNVALSKPTSRSSALGSHESSNAVDGDKSYFPPLFHSTKMVNNWWKVDLLSLHDIKRVIIYNRVDCCRNRLAGYQVDIYASGVVVYTSNDENPGSPHGSVILIDIPSGITGDELKLSLPGRTDYMNIREVEVYA